MGNKRVVNKKYHKKNLTRNPPANLPTSLCLTDIYQPIESRFSFCPKEAGGVYIYEGGIMEPIITEEEKVFINLLENFGK